MKSRSVQIILISTVLFLFLFWLEQVNFLLFHTVVEIIAIIIALLFSVVSWQMYGFTKNHYLMYLGTGYFWIAILDFLHTLSYKGMHIIDIPGVNSAVQFWIGTRYLEALLLVTATIFLTRKLPLKAVFVLFSVISIVICSLIFTQYFPLGFIPGEGLTTFKIYSEYLIIFILSFSVFFHYRYRSLFDERIFKYIIGAILLTMAAELAFTFYINEYGISNFVGHVFKLISFSLIFMAVVRTTLTDPFRALSKFETQYNAVPDATIIIDKQGKILHANNAAYEMTGLQGADLIGKNNHEVFHGDKYRSEEDCFICSSIFDDEMIKSEDIRVDKNRWSEFTVAKIESEDAYIEVIRDVTEQKSLETSLLKTQEVAHLGSWEMDIESQILRWSDETYRIFGINKGAPLTYEMFLSYVHPDDRYIVDNAYSKSVQEKLVGYEIEHRIINKKSGEVRYVHEKCKHVKNNEGDIVYSYGMVHDITELKSAKENIELKKNFISEILDAMPNSVITINDAGEILTFNKTCEKLFEFNSDEVIGKNVSMLMPEFHASRHDNYINKYLNTGVKKIIGIGREVYIQTKNKDVIPVYLSISETLSENDNVKVFIGSMIDLREQKEHEMELRRASKLDALGKLTGGIAHDYNNMLGVVLGYTEILLDKLEDQPQYKKYLEQIMHASHRSSELTSKLLGITKTNTADKLKIDINKVIQNEKLVLERTLTPSIKITYSLAPSLWLTWIDEGDFEDALLNLSINAKHAMGDQGELIIETYNKIVLEKNSENLKVKAGEYVVLAITDTGHGMDKNTLESIFDPFFSTKGDFGTGLGLTQVYGFIQRSNGYIDVESLQGKGTTFYLYFSRHHDEERDIEEIKENSRKDYKGDSSLLVVDDEVAIANMAKEILSNNGYQVDTANSAKEALLLLEEKKYDLVISDIIMPEIDGFTLKERLNDEYPNTKVLLTSGYHDIEKAKTYSGKIISKPYNADTLLKHVHSILEYSI